MQGQYQSIKNLIMKSDEIKEQIKKIDERLKALKKEREAMEEYMIRNELIKFKISNS